MAYWLREDNGFLRSHVASILELVKAGGGP
jgi:hypothetical protein